MRMLQASDFTYAPLEDETGISHGSLNVCAREKNPLGANNRVQLRMAFAIDKHLDNHHEIRDKAPDPDTDCSKALKAFARS